MSGQALYIFPPPMSWAPLLHLAVQILCRVQKFSPTGQFLMKFGSGADFQNPHSLAWDPVTRSLFVADPYRGPQSAISRWDSTTGSKLSTWYGPFAGSLHGALKLAADLNGYIYTGSDDKTLYKFKV